MAIPGVDTTELELKLALDPADTAALLRHPLLAGAPRLRLRVLNTYFDTPDLHLAQMRVALRLRKIGRRWVQTLKSGGESAGGLHRRDEWEYPLKQGRLDLSLFAGSVLDGLNADQLGALRPLFTTDFVRTAWLLEAAPGSRIEVALDIGGIVCGRRTRPICELELELKSGTSEALFDLAACLMNDVPMRPDSVSKAERAYRLVQRVVPQPVAYTAPTLTAVMSTGEALRQTVLACLVQTESNADSLLAGANDTETLHQLRVALRRMRAALRLAGKTEPAAAQCATAIAAVSHTLGALRDWDVLIEQTLPAILEDESTEVLAGLIARARKQRHSAAKILRAALKAPAWGRALFDVLRWVQSTALAAHQARMEDARALLAKEHRKLLRASAHLVRRSVEQRHEARLRAKKLRYHFEVFADLYAHKNARVYLHRLIALQDALGHLNDDRNALDRIARLHMPADLQDRLRAVLMRNDARYLDDALRARKALKDTTPVWDRPSK